VAGSRVLGGQKKIKKRPACKWGAPKDRGKRPEKAGPMIGTETPSYQRSYAVRVAGKRGGRGGGGRVNPGLDGDKLRYMAAVGKRPVTTKKKENGVRPMGIDGENLATAYGKPGQVPEGVAQ